MAIPTFMLPFVVPVPGIERRREGAVDIYRPGISGDGLLPVIVFVPGGPIPPEMQPQPRDWPVFAGYGSLAADNGAIGVIVDHGLDSPAAFPAAADVITAAVELARALPGADPERVALWFFSGSGLLAADWLRHPPPWLRGIAASYPVMVPLPGMEVDGRFRPIDALEGGVGVPLLVTRVGREQPVIASAVDAFIAAAERQELNLEVIDVVEGHHSFDILDDSDASRAAIQQAMDWVKAALRS